MFHLTRVETCELFTNTTHRAYVYRIADFPDLQCRLGYCSLLLKILLKRLLWIFYISYGYEFKNMTKNMT